MRYSTLTGGALSSAFCFPVCPLHSCYSSRLPHFLLLSWQLTGLCSYGDAVVPKGLTLNTVICRVGDDRSGTSNCSFIFRSSLSLSSSGHVGCGGLLRGVPICKWSTHTWACLSLRISSFSPGICICAGPLDLQDD